MLDKWLSTALDRKSRDSNGFQNELELLFATAHVVARGSTRVARGRVQAITDDNGSTRDAWARVSRLRP